MVDVKEDEIEEAIIYLRQHLQGEIGTWKENDVKEKLKDWRIEKNTSDDTELRKALVNLFDIQTDSDKLPIIDSIIDIIWGISLASVQYPIWTLKYVTSDTEEKSLLTDLHKLFIIDNYANLANSQELATRINERMDELKALISDKGNFYNGFINYIKGIQTIALQESEIDSAISYLNGRKINIKAWSEILISNILKDWRLENSTRKEEEPEIPTTEKEEIVRWVQNLSPEKAKSILNAMCDDNVTLNLLKKYVNK